MQVHGQQKEDQTKQRPAAEQVQKTSDERHEKDQALCLFCFGLYQQGILMGLKWQEPGKRCQVSEDKARNRALKMDTHKSMRPDEILLMVLRDLSDAIARPLWITFESP